MEKALVRTRIRGRCTYKNGSIGLTREGLLTKDKVPDYSLEQFLLDIGTIKGGLNQEDEIKPITKMLKKNKFKVSVIEELNASDFNINDNSFTLVPLNLEITGQKRHEVSAIICENFNIYIFDTDGSEHNYVPKFKKEISKQILNQIKMTINSDIRPGTVVGMTRQKIPALNITYINKEKIQGKDSCSLNTINFINIAKNYADFDDLKKQIASGEMQFKVMAETSKQMQSQTGDIQIIENLGESTGEGVNVIKSPGTENPEYIEFNLGNSRFKMSLSQNNSITKNKYISRPGLIKSIGDRNVLEAIQQKQDKLPNNLKKAVNDRLQQLQPTVQQQTVNTHPEISCLNAFVGTTISPSSGTLGTASRISQEQRPHQGQSTLHPY